VNVVRQTRVICEDGRNDANDSRGTSTFANHLFFFASKNGQNLKSTAAPPPWPWFFRRRCYLLIVNQNGVRVFPALFESSSPTKQ
jgi:hypothetical protein